MKFVTWVKAGVAVASVLGGVAAWNWFLPFPSPGYGEALEVEAFRDCDACPEMIALPTGAYVMRGPERIWFKLPWLIGLELWPKRHVTIAKPYALGRMEVTYDEWDACLAEGGCDKYRPPDENWGRGDRPLVHVSWHHAQSYVKWLSEKTGKRYRLPTEAEWEYAARAGATRHPYPWGRFASHDKASYGRELCPPCQGVVEGKDIWEGTAPVGQFPPNGWGFHDMNGNVYEWTEDCFDWLLPAGKVGQEALISADCQHRAMRGGAWYSNSERITSFYRAYNPADWRDRVIGFRVARDM